MTVQRDMEFIKQRLRDRLLISSATFDLRNAGVPADLTDDEEQLAAILESLRPDGHWDDVDYNCKAFAGWRTVQHLARVVKLGRAILLPGGRWHNDAVARERCLRALDFWLKKDFSNPNWWWREIGTQEKLSCALLLLEPLLSKEQFDAGIRIMQRSRASMTGANMLWKCGSQIVWGCLIGDEAAVAEAYGKIAGEIRVTPGGEEGIKADRGFFQHGTLLYSGGYGLAFSLYCARFGSAAHDTSFGLPDEKLELLSSFILDGQYPMMRFSTFDYSATGREITRRGKNGRTLGIAADYMARANTPRRVEFEALRDEVLHGVHSGRALNRAFWKSEMMVQSRPAYYFSVRMYSPRVRSTECCIGEGLRSHHLADGVTFIMRDGREYADIFGVWNWRRLPGITAVDSSEPFPQGEHTLPPGTTPEQIGEFYKKVVQGIDSRNSRHFVGSVSDGLHGCAAMDFERGALTAKKAWFLFEREVVSLAAGITSSAAEPVLTTFNQCLQRSDALLADDRVLRNGEHKLNQMKWVHHDGIGYVFPVASDVNLKLGPQRGNWRDISSGRGDDPDERDVFSLWVDHGARPQNARTACIIVPGIVAGEMTAYANGAGVEILSNTADLQAVRHRELDLLQCVFWRAGKLTADSDISIETDSGCLCMARRESHRLVISVSDPTQQLESVSLVVNSERIVISLPRGEEAGSTVIRTIAAK